MTLIPTCLTQLPLLPRDCHCPSQAPVAALWPDLSPSQLSHLQTTLQLVHDPGQGLHVEWLQEFGCALLPLPPSALAAALHPDHAALYLMAPDGWTFDTHRWGPGLNAAAFASCNCSSSQVCDG